jgi:hypothetical protein
MQEGIVNFHGYALFEAREVETVNGQVRLLKIRNTWGQTEWTGAWSDNSQEWLDNPGLLEELCSVNKDDGVFWIAIEDFIYQFNIIWHN